MTDSEKIIELNKNKHLIEVGDYVYSNKYGFGIVTEVLYGQLPIHSEADGWACNTLKPVTD
jgi:hypothetical protein